MAIFSLIPVVDGISKSELFRKLKTDKSKFLKAVNHLIDLGYIAQEKQGNKHILTRIDVKNDIETFNGVLEWQTDLLDESVKKLLRHKKLFKVRRYKKKPTEYKPINGDVMQDLIHFSMFIDHLMQHSNKYNYAKNFKIITEREAKFRIDKIEKIVRKRIDQVFEKHKKEFVGIIYWIKKIERTWNVLL